MDFQFLVDGIKGFGSTSEDICRSHLGCCLEVIHENVVITPWWKPEVFGDYWIDVEEISQDKVWNIKTEHGDFTYVRTGIGAPVVGDATLVMGLSKCKHIMFIGSAGAIDAEIAIGDFVVPEYAVTGNGFTRYLTSNNLACEDDFGQRYYPNKNINEFVRQVVHEKCKGTGIGFHTNNVYSTDSVFAEFAHIDEIKSTGCNIVEMEVATFLKAASLTGMKATTILQISDNLMGRKTLYSGRSSEEKDRRKALRRELYPLFIDGVFYGGK